MAKFLNEFQYFRRQPHNMKVLLITNLCFAFVLPVIEIFVGAYIMRNTNNPSFVAVYQRSTRASCCRRLSTVFY